MRFMKVPYQTIGNPAISAALYLLIFGLSLGPSINLKEYPNYLAFLIPGLLTMSVIRNSVDNSTSSILAAKYVNELQDLRIAPLPLQTILWSKTIGSLIRGLMVALITYLIGIAFFYYRFGILYPIKHPYLFLGFVSLGGLAFGKLGICIAMYAKTFEQAGGISTFVLLPLIYLGGVFFPLDNMHPLWKHISEANPIFYLIDAVRFTILGYSDIHIGVSFLVCLGFLISFHLLALFSLRAGYHYYR